MDASMNEAKELQLWKFDVLRTHQSSTAIPYVNGRVDEQYHIVPFERSEPDIPLNDVLLNLSPRVFHLPAIFGGGGREMKEPGNEVVYCFNEDKAGIARMH